MFSCFLSQAKLHLMQSLDEVHRKYYRVAKWLLCSHILESYKVKMVILDHVYNSKCQPQADIGECVLEVLESLLNNYYDLKMPTYFLRSCCLITKEGEGKTRYLDYLIDATGLNMSKIPVMDTEFTELHGYKNYADWLDMFAWYEFQRRCINLIISMLRYLASVEELLDMRSCRRMFTALTVFFDTEIGPVSLPGLNGVPRFGARPTREWRDRVLNLSQRVFIPAFSLMLDNIQAILGERFSIPGVSSTPPIPLCLLSPVMGFSQGHTGSSQWKDPNGDLYLSQGATCYFAELYYEVVLDACMHLARCPSLKASRNSTSLLWQACQIYQGGPSSQLVRGSSLKVGLTGDRSDSEEIPDFRGSFHCNVRYDGEAFMEKKLFPIGITNVVLSVSLLVEC